MGDLNSTPNPKIDRSPPKKSSIPESNLLKYLKQNHFYDTFRLFYPTDKKFTCSHRNSFSRIDQIWTNIHITLLDYADILSDTLTDSDHNITILEITLSAYKNNSQKYHTRNSYLWNQATIQQLINYKQHTEQSFQLLTKSSKQLKTQSDFNLLWNKINKILSKAAKKHIPFKKIKINSTLKNQPQQSRSPYFYQYKHLIS
jgi:hypothetical protein